ncbi:hypothetical protein HDV00_004887 [Rhizophlyctis rosea]|nr:hypothetical protein HDV00_004887 [Rhizophlyctis rosea]
MLHSALAGPTSKAAVVTLKNAFSENGPCLVNPDSSTTKLNLYSWTTHSNMLYIDQPIHIGFSYDTITKGKVGLLSGGIFPDGTPQDQMPTQDIYVDGLFASQNMATTANTTTNAARVLWKFMQAFMTEPRLKKYRRDSINVWSQS